MNPEAGKPEGAAATAARELAQLHLLADGVRAELTRLQQEVIEAESRLINSQAAQLVEANEQLVLAALRAQSDAVTTAISLDEVSHAAELHARTELHAREVLARMNANLEDRVTTRTRELEHARDEALTGVRAKEQFLSNMSHEIRTPMNGMLGALELLSKTELTSRQAEFIHVAAVSGEALLGIINEVLDFAKIGAGHFHLASEPIDVNAIAGSVTTVFSASAQRKAIELRLVADPSLSGWRVGDALRIRQVLMNLVGNAIKFTPRGEVVVTTRRIGDATSERMAFDVKDTGIGIDAAQHERIFEAFVQADPSPQRREGGTGLGLAISQNLARAMGGELGVTSTPGQGATFSFELSLPYAPDTAPDAAPHGVPVEQPAGAQRLAGRVLLVEDNSVNRLIGTAMLEFLGLEVVLAEHGEEALARLAEAACSAVLMDCEMPVMDGYEATHRLREVERLGGQAHTPVIAVTANAFSADVQRCLAAGMDAHLAKPFTVDQLRACLAQWLPSAAA